MAIRACRKQGKYVGICGQGPSDHPDLARWLMEQGIESMSLNPDTVVSTWMALAEAPIGQQEISDCCVAAAAFPGSSPSRACRRACRAAACPWRAPISSLMRPLV